MDLMIDNIAQFKVFFDVIYDMASELVELQLYTDRLVCAMLDRTKTRFFHVEYDIDFFENYNVTEEVSVVVYVEDIHKLLKSANNSDILSLQVNDPYLVAKLESKNGNTRLFEFVLPSDFIDSPAPPHADFPVEFEVGVGGLKQGVKDIGLLGSDLISFVVTGDKLTLNTSTEITTLYASEMDINTIKADNATASFTLDYISQMLKFDKISKNVRIKIGEDMPIFYYFNDDIMGVKVSGMIAPRISED